MANNFQYTDEAMTFEEIGQQLGITAGTASALYRSGMIKLRGRSRTPLFQKLRKLAQSRRQETESRML
jgi:DNA-binding CsgD family transcriptional regulator